MPLARPIITMALIGLLSLAGCQTMVWQSVEGKKSKRKVAVGGQEASPDLLAQVKARREQPNLPGSRTVVGTAANSPASNGTNPTSSVLQPKTDSSQPADQNNRRQPPHLTPHPKPQHQSPPIQQIATQQSAKKSKPKQQPETRHAKTTASVESKPTKGAAPSKTLKITGLSRDRSGRAVAIIKTKKGETLLVKQGETVNINDNGGSRRFVVTQILERVVELKDVSSDEVISVR